MLKIYKVFIPNNFIVLWTGFIKCVSLCIMQCFFLAISIPKMHIVLYAGVAFSKIRSSEVSDIGRTTYSGISVATGSD